MLLEDTIPDGQGILQDTVGRIICRDRRELHLAWSGSEV